MRPCSRPARCSLLRRPGRSVWKHSQASAAYTPLLAQRPSRAPQGTGPCPARPLCPTRTVLDLQPTHPRTPPDPHTQRTHRGTRTTPTRTHTPIISLLPPHDQESYRPTEVEPGLWIVPVWSVAPEPAATNVVLEPGAPAHRPRGLSSLPHKLDTLFIMAPCKLCACRPGVSHLWPPCTPLPHMHFHHTINVVTTLYMCSAGLTFGTGEHPSRTLPTRKQHKHCVLSTFF